MTQFFAPNDPRESQVYNLFASVLGELEADKDAFYENAYDIYGLGEILYDLKRDPLSDVIARDIYRQSYPAIHELFTRPGTFEFYISVLRRVFSENTEIEFDVPAPGHLVIEINALNIEQYNLVAREIVDGSYVYHPLVTSDFNEPIMAQVSTGIKTQSEIDGLMVEISSYGVYTTISLVIPED